MEISEWRGRKWSSTTFSRTSSWRRRRYTSCWSGTCSSCPRVGQEGEGRERGDGHEGGWVWGAATNETLSIKISGEFSN